ncbi:hypothetical protein ANN_14546, partial [Periplaneta americana]
LEQRGQTGVERGNRQIEETGAERGNWCRERKQADRGNRQREETGAERGNRQREETGAERGNWGREWKQTDRGNRQRGKTGREDPDREKTQTERGNWDREREETGANWDRERKQGQEEEPGAARKKCSRKRKLMQAEETGTGREELGERKYEQKWRNEQEPKPSKQHARKVRYGIIIRGATAREGPRPTSRLLASRPHAEEEMDDHPTRMEVSCDVVFTLPFIEGIAQLVPSYYGVSATLKKANSVSNNIVQLQQRERLSLLPIDREMSPGSSTESYPAFARIGLRENPGKNLNQVTCPDRDSNPGHLVSRPDALTVTPQSSNPADGAVIFAVDKYKIVKDFSKFFSLFFAILIPPLHTNPFSLSSPSRKIGHHLCSRDAKAIVRYDRPRGFSEDW